VIFFSKLCFVWRVDCPLNSTLQTRTFSFGEFPKFQFFWGDGPIKLANSKKEKLIL